MISGLRPFCIQMYNKGMNPLKTIVIALFIVIADQLSKWAVMEHILRPLHAIKQESVGLFDWFASAPDRLPYLGIDVTPFFNFVVVWNQGVSFGLFNNDSDLGPYLLIALSFVIILCFGIWAFRTHSLTNHIGIALVIGGAIGNVIDRFRFGAVFDFLDVHVFGHHWPAFNIADSAICTGVFILMIYTFLFEKSLHTEG